MKIKHILFFGTALLMAGCSREENVSKDTLSDEDKTPLVIEASLGTGYADTKAAGKNFAENDQLLVYLRHTIGTTIGSYTLVTTDKSPLLVTFTKGSVAMSTVNANTNRTANDLTSHIPLYWEDFSNSASDATDLRSDNHGLQSYYGYCYNGGTPTVAVDATDESKAAGTLTWTIASQASAEDVQHSDLLWSPEQMTKAYHKGPMAFSASQAIEIPFTHAMSEITVEVTAGTGFSGSPLTNTTLTLNGMSTVTTLTAPTGSAVSVPGDGNVNIKSITMCPGTYSTGLTRTYTAIVGPGTKLKVDERLLNIDDVDDNNYKLNVTSAMLADDKWASGHTVHNDDGTYIYTQPGYNYHLNVSVSKTVVDADATLTDWTTVTASGEGEIQFDDDDVMVMDDGAFPDLSGVQVVAIDQDKFTQGSSFSLFMVKKDDDHDTPAERTNESYSFATVPEYQSKTAPVEDFWENNPAIYWPNKTDNFYFRALASDGGETAGVKTISSVGTYASNKGTAVSQGTTDILWGNSARHKGSTTNHIYERGEAIPPRTGGVPIAFEHALSKVTFQLETAAGEVNANSPAVTLTGATIAVSNLSTSGTIAIEDGAVTPAAVTAAAIAATAAPISGLIVIPQTIGDAANVTITLSDGTTYKLQLNQCVITGGSTPIGQWERGKHYEYTIHIEKEAITFRVLIKDWDKVYGSGNANLEWD